MAQVHKAYFDMGIRSGKVAAHLKEFQSGKAKLDVAMITDIKILVDDMETLKKGPITTIQARAYSNNDILEVLTKAYSGEEFNKILGHIEDTRLAINALLNGKEAKDIPTFDRTVDFFHRIDEFTHVKNASGALY